ncbi:MAG: c-type cytochrome, partial [Marinicella sp.]
TMRMMSIGLGVRCQHCHVGEEGQSLKTIDFSDDEKENKEKARFMLKMMMDLNQHMVTGIKDRSVEIECMTCHRGAVKPMFTVDILKETFNEKGIDAALAHHDELKQQYFGSHTHDFTEWTLINLAQSAHSTDPGATIKTLKKNLEIYPKSFQTIFVLAESYAAAKDMKSALSYYEKAYEINPDPRLETKIKTIKEQL